MAVRAQSDASQFPLLGAEIIGNSQKVDRQTNLIDVQVLRDLIGKMKPEEVSMSAPLIGMSFASFVVLLIISGIAGAIIHWGFHYRLFQGIDGCLAQWMVAWLGAWLGPAVLGHWFDFAMVANIYIIPAFLGALAGAFGGTVNAKVLAGVASQRAMSSS